jgi:IS5 family transposase
MLLKDYFPNLNKKYQKVSFKGIAFNSRKIKKGYIFFALKGSNTDGNLFIKDATIIKAHQAQGKTKDAEAGWCVKKNAQGKEETTYGYKVHSNCDEDGFILRQEVTAGNVYDGNKREDLLTGEESQLYADSVYDSKEGRKGLERRGVENRVQRKGCSHKKLTEADHSWNAEVGVTRAIIEHQFAEYKERYGLRRTRFMGRMMNACHAGLAAITHNPWQTHYSFSKTWVKKSLSHPAFLRLAVMPVLIVLSCLSKFSAMRLMIDRFSAALPVRVRLRSSAKLTSKLQCRLISTSQCRRAAFMNSSICW